MSTFKKIISEAREEFKKLGFSKERLRTILAVIGKRQVVMKMAQKAFDANVPREEGPVWFGADEWKTDFWRLAWDIQKAYREGERARTDFDSRDSNPYRMEKLPFQARKLALETAWNRGFDNKPI